MALKLVSGLFLVLLFGLCHAQQYRYVTDEQEFTIRFGKSTSHRIVQLVSSGTRLEVLAVDDRAGYTRVRTPEGKEGWILTRFLMDEPGAREQLETYREKVAHIDQIEATLKQRIAELERQQSSMATRLKEVTAERDSVTRELAELKQTAANALALSKDNKKLNYRVAVLQEEKRALAQQNARLEDSTERQWFVRGAGVVGAGILIGLLLPHLRFRRRRNSWRHL
jgi:SH3 domain protein